MNRTALACTTIAALGLFASAALLTAGPLNPPAGAVTSTHKTLTEVEPRVAINAANTPGDAGSVYRITRPGAYYLTGDIDGAAGRHGIRISADNVSIDLMGFTLRGTPGSLDGISLDAARQSITVRNGSVAGFGGDGIDLATAPATGGLIADVVTSGNAGAGCTVFAGMVIRGVVASSNGGHGISAEDACTITACSARSNGVSGIVCLGRANTVTGCTALENGSNGIYANSGGLIADCVAGDNGENGFNVVSGGSVQRCVAHHNTLNGIRGIDLVLISECKSSLNDGAGIWIRHDGLVAGNSCDHNGKTGGLAGIHVQGNENRIESNHCTDNGVGYKVIGDRNLLVRNQSVSNATNWDVAAENVCLVVQAVAGKAFVGDSGGAAPGSTDPSVNFSH